MPLDELKDIAGFNLEAYYIYEHGTVRMAEFIPTMTRFGTLSENEEYLGVSFFVDNIEDRIWVYQDEYVKTQKPVKKLKKEKKDEKLQKLTASVFEKLLNYSIEGYDVKRALSYKDHFMKIFKYQINEFPLYKKHYLLPQYEAMEGYKEAEEELPEDTEPTVRKCANCGWIISANTEICPKCKRPADKKFEEKN